MERHRMETDGGKALADVQSGDTHRTRVLSVVGARPQFVKVAAFARALAAVPGIQSILVHTGQHFDRGMSAVFFDELGIAEPHVNLGIGGGSHGEATGRMLAAIEAVILAEKPDLVVVFGDTNSTLAGALAAAKLHVPVAHLEAGVRSFNRLMPEEINRVLTDHISALLLAPTATAVGNLHAEGIDHGVHKVGDLMFDSARFAATECERSTILTQLGLKERGYSVATLHRAENTADRSVLVELIDFLKEQAHEHPLVLPIHPRTRKVVDQWGISLDGIIVCEPLGYLDMHRLIRSAATIFTDSGGVQNEAYFHRVPCVTLRDETEWVETVEAGWNRLWKVPHYQPRRDIPGYGDGRAAERAIVVIQEFLGGR
jgi:UDP-GlcNAc3NAcA epimerase